MNVGSHFTPEHENGSLFGRALGSKASRILLPRPKAISVLPHTQKNHAYCAGSSGLVVISRPLDRECLDEPRVMGHGGSGREQATIR